MNMKNDFCLLALLLLIAAFSACSSSDDSVPGDADGDQVPDGDQPEDGDQATDGDEDLEIETDKEAAEGFDFASVDYWQPPSIPTCGSGEYSGRFLIAGPGEDNYDAELDRLARQYDRQFHVFTAQPMAVNADVSVYNENAEKREWITRFLQEDDGWDFTEFSGGLEAADVVDAWHKVAGLYGGAGIMADAMRYAVLRDQGADCGEIEIAREQFLRSLDALHLAFTIAGVPGVVVRGFIRTDIPGYGSDIETIPLTDAEGNPLPEEKTNGTWRADQSGLYPNYIMEDSCSRDMMLGWAAASAVAAEVMRGDDSFSEELRARIRDDCEPVGRELRKIRESGYDLEFPDVDGRTTFHGYINEHSVERSVILPSFRNGFYALMALGIVAAYAYASEDPEAEAYLYDELIGQRELPTIALEDMKYMNMGLQSNYSNYNMAFLSAWLAYRYIKHPETREIIRETAAIELYDTPDAAQQPVGTKMSLYDFIIASTQLETTAFTSPGGSFDPQPLADGQETLSEFAEPPYWDIYVEQCDEAELSSGDCVFDDGTQTVVHDGGGRKGSTVCDHAIPKRMRRPSNFEWRSNPYNPNGGGDGSGLLPGVDFRVAYWLGRWTRIAE